MANGAGGRFRPGSACRPCGGDVHRDHGRLDVAGVGGVDRRVDLRSMTRALSAIWAVASETPEYAELTKEIESAMRLNFDLGQPPAAVAAAAAAPSTRRWRRSDAHHPSSSRSVRPRYRRTRTRARRLRGLRSEDARLRRERSAPMGSAGSRPSQLVGPPSCSLVPPAALRVLLDDPVATNSSRGTWFGSIGIGKPGAVAADAALATLGGAGEVSADCRSSWGPTARAPAVCQRPVHEVRSAMRARQSQLLTVLTAYTAPPRTLSRGWHAKRRPGRCDSGRAPWITRGGGSGLQIDLEAGAGRSVRHRQHRPGRPGVSESGHRRHGHGQAVGRWASGPPSDCSSSQEIPMNSPCG